MIIEAPASQAVVDEKIHQVFFDVKPENLPYVFEILRKSLYKHPIMAVVREYSSNANDAHIKAENTSTPFIVHAPSPLEPYFSVRDFGPGLSRTDVQEIFVSYGASTKRQDSDQIGGFGIGSKSAFAYADSFDVTSWYDGVRTQYMCFIDDTGVGKLAVVNEQPSTEPNGIEIEVRLSDPEHRQSFVDAILTIFSRCKFKAVFTGDLQVAYQLDQAAAEPVWGVGDGWEVRKSCQFSQHWRAWQSYSGVTAILNGVAYPVEFDLVKVDEFIRSSHHFEVMLNIDGWGIMPGPSRESITLTDVHLPRLHAIGAEARQLVTEKLRTMLAMTTNDWENAVRRRKLTDAYRYCLGYDRYNPGTDDELLPPVSTGKLEPHNGLRLYRRYHDSDKKTEYQFIRSCSVFYEDDVLVLIAYGRRDKDILRHACEWSMAQAGQASKWVYLACLPDEERAKKFLESPGLKGVPHLWFYRPTDTGRPLPKAKVNEVLELADDLRPRLKRCKPADYWRVRPAPSEAFTYVYLSGYRLDERNGRMVGLTPFKLRSIEQALEQLGRKVKVYGVSEPHPNGMHLMDVVNQTFDACPVAMTSARMHNFGAKVPGLYHMMSPEDLPPEDVAIRNLLLHSTTREDGMIRSTWEKHGRWVAQIIKAIGNTDEYMPDLEACREAIHKAYPHLRFMEGYASHKEAMSYIEMVVQLQRYQKAAIEGTVNEALNAHLAFQAQQ